MSDEKDIYGLTKKDNNEYFYRCEECDHEWIFICNKFDSVDVYFEPCPGCGVKNDTITNRPKIIDDTFIGTTSGSCVSTKNCGRKSGGYFNNKHALKQNSGQHQELLQKIHEGTPGSKLNEKFK